MFYIKSSIAFQEHIHSGLANSQGGPNNKNTVYHADPLRGRNIKIVRQLEQVFEPYRSIFRDEGGKQKQLPLHCF
jgi:hypothetical protein